MRENAAPTYDPQAPLIEARGLTKHYADFSLHDIDLTVMPGEVVGLIGKNGSGKSTTIKSLLGLIALDAGEARVLGVPSAQLTRASSAVSEQIGVVFDTMSLPGHLTVAEATRLMRRAYATWDEGIFGARTAELGLSPRKKLKELSRGMGMRFSLACALAHRPRLLILDEATAGLDPMARDEVLEDLRAFVSRENDCGELVCGILMSSHITSDLDKIADRIMCIDAGSAVFSMAKDEIADLMGIARCRASQVERVLETGLAGDAPRAIRRDLGVDLAVPDRFAFARALPDIPCDHMTIDDYMAFMLCGERL